MTCREFQHAAASLTLWELARSDDQQLFQHGLQCAKCAVWMDEQQALAAAMKALQARTAGREAGPHVERALLRAFGQKDVEAAQRVAAFRSTPIAFRLSRFFQVGAYAAVAAAILVGLFLGIRLLERRAPTSRVATQPAGKLTAPPAAEVAAQSAVTSPEQHVQAARDISPPAVAPTMRERPGMPVKRELAAHPVSQGGRARHFSAAAASPTADDPDYVALMFCDPLICSSDAQVVRVELPVAGASAAETQLADVVVGDDGLVRAMRIVN